MFYIEKKNLDRINFFRSKKNFVDQKKNFFRSKKIFEIKKMDIARRLFNDQHPATSLIDLFGKRFKIDENEKVFRWLCLNKASNYLTYMRICELADYCCVTKSDRGFDIKVEMNKNRILVQDIREWLLTRKIKDRHGNDFGTIENISLFRTYKWK